MKADSPRSLERIAFAVLVSLLLAPVIAVALWRPLLHVFGPAGNAAAIAISALATGAAVIFLLRWLPRRLPSSLDGLIRRHKLLTALYVSLALLAVVSTTRLSIFIGDSSRVSQQALPGEKFLETHSCLTAYVHAAMLSRKGVSNLYDERWWHGSHGLPPRSTDADNPYPPFILDYYAYPPPFLLIMTPLAPLEGDFPAQRALWFGLNGLLLALGLWIVARWIDGPGAHRTLLLGPLLFGSLPILATLQVGNFQIAVVMISVLAMVAFHKDRPALGGALLAFTILSKISPGLLGIVLVAQRRWKAVAWTAGFGAVFLALSLLLSGTDPMKSFLTYTLPRLGTGEAFAFMDDEPFSVVTNMSPFGIPFKLQLLGIDAGDPWVMGRRIARVYTVLLAILAIAAARRTGDRRTHAMTWMSLLVLAALQSPFAPGYVLIGLLWAITLWSNEVRTVLGGLALVFLWLLIVAVLPGVSLKFYAINSLLQSALAIGVPIWLLLRPTPPPALPANV